jgi:hypothetical protein
MKSTAEQVLADAFRVAQRIVWASGTVREVVAEASKATVDQLTKEPK